MERKLSICHVITRMIIGGAQENTLLTIAGHLGKGHEVTLVTGPTTGPEGNLLQKECPAGLRVVEVPSLVRRLDPGRDLRALLALGRIFREGRFDVVHTHASKAGILGRIAARRAGVPVVVHTVHGQAFHPYQAAWRNRLYVFLERLAARRCDRIYAVAQAMVEQCVRAGVAPREKYKVVYSGMRLEDFLDRRPEEGLRRRLGIPDGCPVVGTIARLFELKGHDCLIKAAVPVVARLPEVRFLLVGDGVLRGDLERRIAAAGLERNFVFAGLVPPSEVCRYTALMDVLAHLSLREGLPRTCVQALAAGVPVVAYPLDGTPEVVLDRRTGILCRPEDIGQISGAILELLQDRELRRRLGENGRRLVRSRFGWRRMADVLEREYLAELERKEEDADH